jgi:hypothetical protein
MKVSAAERQYFAISDELVRFSFRLRPHDESRPFRTFQISEEFQEGFGYPAITDEIRAKVFGLSSARIYGIEPVTRERAQAADALDRAKAGYAQSPDPSFRSYGPRTRREFFALARSGH